MPTERVELRAIAFARQYLETHDYTVEDVSRDRRHRGYDLLASRAQERLKIEVKGCTRPWGIPDPYVTEFDENNRLVADYLYVVYFLSGEDPRLCAIPRDAIDPTHVRPRVGYRISGRFKNARALSRYLVK